jgi:hypothetical protein
MNDHNDESRPAFRIQRRLRRDEALMEIVRAEGLFSPAMNTRTFQRNPEAHPPPSRDRAEGKT